MIAFTCRRCASATVKKLPLERLSQRTIARTVHMRRNTIAALLKKR